MGVASVRMTALWFAVCSIVCAAESTANRPAHWAQPVEVNGVPNLFRVSDSLYRSGQFSADGARGLKRLGIATIVNLRSFHSDRDEIGDAGIACEDIPMTAWGADREHAVKFLKIVTDPKRAPVLVHCWHGADRTGAMIAVYRVAVQGWSKDEAIREMTDGGFGFHAIWINLPKWIRELDIEAVAQEAGIQSPRPANSSRRDPKPPVDRAGAK